MNQSIVAHIQRDGLVIPSSTRIDGNVAIRAAIFNHRTTTAELDLLVESVLSHARRLCRTARLLLQLERIRCPIVP